MPHIPRDAKWFIADLVVEMNINSGITNDNVIHVNIMLVQAGSAEEAYAKALELGRAYEDTYINTDGNKVDVKFRGLRDLNVIHDELEHGAELVYESRDGLTEEEIKALVCPKQALAVFRPGENGPPSLLG